MSELDALLDAEAEHTEQHRDATAKSDTKVSRPGHGRSAVFSVRLNADEVAALEAAAEDAGLPPSTLARSWILERIRYGSSPAGLDLRNCVRGTTSSGPHSTKRCDAWECPTRRTSGSGE